MAKAPSTPKAPSVPAKNVSVARSAAFEEPKLEHTKGVQHNPIKAVIYGPGGVGKTSLAGLLGEHVQKLLFVDIEYSSEFLDVERVHPKTWQELRGYLRGEAILEFDGIVLDSSTLAVDFCERFVIETIPHEKGRPIHRLDDYGWGKGLDHVYDEFLPLLSDLDRLVNAGKHIIVTAHDVTSVVPNPEGDDFLRYEPRLPPGKRKGESNVRARVCEWCDHLLFVNMDQHVKDGKVEGVGTRTIYPYKMPTFMAKSRSLDEPVDFKKDDASFWELLF